MSPYPLSELPPASGPPPPLVSRAPSGRKGRSSSPRSSPWRPQQWPSPPPCAPPQGVVGAVRTRGPTRRVSTVRYSSAGRRRRAGGCGRPWPRRRAKSRRARRRSRSPRGPSPARTSRRPGSARAAPRGGRRPGRSRSTRTCSRPRSPPSPRSAPSSSTPTSGRCSGSSAPTAPCTRRSWASSSSPASRPPRFCGSRPCRRRTERPRSKTAETDSCEAVVRVTPAHSPPAPSCRTTRTAPPVYAATAHVYVTVF